MEMPAEKTRSRPGRLFGHVKNTMAAGLLVVVPFGITLFVLRFLFSIADGILAPYIKGSVRLFFGHDIYIPGLGMIAGFITLYFAGVLATNVLGRRLVASWDRLVGRIPVVKPIYTAAKQVVEVFSRKKENPSFRQAVFVDFPRPGCYSLAYVTNEVVSADGQRYLSCFVPTIPNPTTGFVLMVEESRVYPARMTVEEAMKVVMSCGMVAPEILRADHLQ